jgi:hypothetical protein
MRYPYLILTPLFILMLGMSTLYSCHSKAHQKHNDSTQSAYTSGMPPKLTGSDKHDSIAIQQVKQLPEIKELQRRITFNRDTTHHIVLSVEKRPDSRFKYYKVLVGDKGPDTFQLIFHFYVDPKMLSVFYYDAPSDSVFTLEQWRKSGKDWIK